MEILKRILPALMFLALPALAEQFPHRVIAYHDIRDDVAGDYDPDQYALSTSNLIDQFTWLRDNGFQPVSVDQILAARSGGKPLPENSVLLTFDDGLVSVYTHVLPLLRLFQYPAVVSVVTSWIESDAVVDYADRKLRQSDFLSWEQIRELQESGLVEIASHSHNMHIGVRGNPQGNTQPAAVTRAFDGKSYEDEATYVERINADLARSVSLIEENTGKAPRIITWPYGANNSLSASVAAKNGLPINFTLEPESSDEGHVLRIGRTLMIANPKLAYFSSEMSTDDYRPIVRVAQVDLDYVYDPDPERQN